MSSISRTLSSVSEFVEDVVESVNEFVSETIDSVDFWLCKVAKKLTESKMYRPIWNVVMFGAPFVYIYFLAIPTFSVGSYMLFYLIVAHAFVVGGFEDLVRYFNKRSKKGRKS